VKLIPITIEDGMVYKEVIYKGYERLKQLGNEYESRGYQVRINNWDNVRWIMTAWKSVEDYNVEVH